MAGVDVILDCMGAAYFQRNLDSLNFDGRLHIIGLMGGAATEFNLGSLFAKRLTVQGTLDLLSEMDVLFPETCNNVFYGCWMFV